jgi:hypothetical protein
MKKESISLISYHVIVSKILKQTLLVIKKKFNQRDWKFNGAYEYVHVN